MKNIIISVSLALISASALAELPFTGGKTTTHKQGASAFSQPANNLALIEKVDFSVGNAFFKNPWVIAPSSTTARDGLGPLFNTNGCQSCHIKDGRGHAPIDANDNAISMLIRLSIPATTDEERTRQKMHGPIAEPNYGGQLQDHAVIGVQPEGKIEVTWQYEYKRYPDGTEIELRQPNWNITDLAYGDLHPSVQMSARVAPMMIGLGLLEQISSADILKNADEHDSNQDGISGKANWVPLANRDGREPEQVLGRFGWKAGMPTLEQQNAGAFNGDLGITSNLFKQDHCTDAQTACLAAPNGHSEVDGVNELELQEDVLSAVTFYSRHLAVPKQRVTDKKATELGEKTFKQIGCEQCHISQFSTPTLANLSALSEQTFHPFTDLLLHDMGEGLADHREEFLANGREWRTAPLWGLGYLQEVNGHQDLLHDGRARNIEEAIWWHGGESENSRDQFIALPAEKRQALITFLNSL